MEPVAETYFMDIYQELLICPIRTFFVLKNMYICVPHIMSYSFNTFSKKQ